MRELFLAAMAVALIAGNATAELPYVGNLLSVMVTEPFDGVELQKSLGDLHFSQKNGEPCNTQPGDPVAAIENLCLIVGVPDRREWQPESWTYLVTQMVDTAQVEVAIQALDLLLIDTDGDGYVNSEDCCPTDPTRWE